jgi:hypothetical protein
MASVDLAPEGNGGYRLVVDGVDITQAVEAEGFAVRFDRHRGPVVSLSLLPGPTRVSLPDAVLELLTPTANGCPLCGGEPDECERRGTCPPPDFDG